MHLNHGLSLFTCRHNYHFSLQNLKTLFMWLTKKKNHKLIEKMFSNLKNTLKLWINRNCQIGHQYSASCSYQTAFRFIFGSLVGLSSTRQI